MGTAGSRDWGSPTANAAVDTLETAVTEKSLVEGSGYEIITKSSRAMPLARRPRRCPGWNAEVGVREGSAADL